MKMDRKLLQVFTTLADSLHFSQTAHAHHVSPSTLSRMIQRIEDELGCQLLQRDNRTVQLTEAGSAFNEFAKQQLQSWQQLQQQLQQGQGQLKGKLSIYCSVTAAYSHLPKLLDSFRQLYPQVDIILDTGNAADAIDKVTNGEVDFAIAAYPETLPKSCHFYSIAQIPLSIIAPTIDCQVSQQLESRNIDWAKIPFILPDHGSSRLRFQQWYRQKKLGKPHIYAAVSGHEALVSMVALGCGVGIAPEVVIENSPVKERIKRLTAPSVLKPFELGVCYLKKNINDAVIAAFLDSIRDV